MKKNTSSSQVLVNQTVRKKRGPYNKLSKQKLLDGVRELYFEEEYSMVDIAKTLGINRNTVTSYVQYWKDEYEKQGMGDEIKEFFYKENSFLKSLKRRLSKKLKTESDFDSQNKLVKLLLGLHDRQMKFYLKFSPMVKKSPKISAKLVKKIIRELTFDEFSFSGDRELIKEIIRKTKYDVPTAKSIVDEMRKLGLDYTENRGLAFASLLDSNKTSMTELATICGYLSSKEISSIQKEQDRRAEQDSRRADQEKQEYDKRFSEYYIEFGKKHGYDSKNWSKEVRREFSRGCLTLDNL